VQLSDDFATSLNIQSYAERRISAMESPSTDQKQDHGEG
jgi:hypothetical protein